MNKELVEMAFSKYYRTDFFTLEEAIEFLWKRDLINVGELAEIALSKKGNLKKASRGNKGYDFDDKSDSKYVTVCHYAKGSYANISGIQNKIGTLRVMAHEPLTNKNYYFKVPYRVYEPYTGANDSIKIWFDSCGNPRNPTRNTRNYNLWDHRCSKEEWLK
jgi:hypothetical protein